MGYLVCFVPAGTEPRIPKRWAAFKQHRTDIGQPVVGSIGIFRTIWKSHDEIVEEAPTGHAICNDCGKYHQVYDEYQGRVDEAAIAARRVADERFSQHKMEYKGEIAYAEDIWGKSEENPTHTTALNFDSPTQSQLDIPVQKRKTRDVARRVETLKKWGCKMVGVMSAGLGMYAYVAAEALGAGPNLSLTVLYLTLLVHAASSRPLGLRLNVLMDNTGSDNKCGDMILFLSWLVQMDHFRHASFFCMLKGHTFTVIDRFPSRC